MLASAQTAPLQLGEIVRPLPLGTAIQGELPGPDRALVIEFWATWCEPCRATIPHLNELRRAFANEPVEFVHITDENPAKVREFLAKYPIEGVVTSHPERTLAAAVKFSGLPTTILLDRQHRLVAVTKARLIRETDLRSLVSGELVRLGDSRFPNPEPVLSAPQATVRGHALMQVEIRPSLGGDGSVVESAGWYRGTGVRITDLLSWAYQVPIASISIPEELSGLRYDVSAAVPSDRPETLWPVVVAALAASVPVRVAVETRMARALVVGGSPSRLKPAKAGGKTESMCGAESITARSAPLSALQSCIESRLNVPVIMEEAPNGLFDYELEWDPANPDGVLSALSNLGFQGRFEDRPTKALKVSRLPLPRVR